MLTQDNGDSNALGVILREQTDLGVEICRSSLLEEVSCLRQGGIKVREVALLKPNTHAKLHQAVSCGQARRTGLARRGVLQVAELCRSDHVLGIKYR